MLFGILGICLYHTKRWPLRRWDSPHQRELLKIGAPAAGQMTMEVGVFALATTLSGRLSPPDTAAHQLALNLSAMTFMVPMGISASAAVLVGQSLGRGEPHKGIHQGWIALKAGFIYNFLTCLLFTFFPLALLSFYTTDSATLAVGQKIMVVAAFFQLADGCQCISTGALRGLAHTRLPMIANAVGHWFVGLPLGLSLCFWLGYGLVGLWVGLATGLVVVAVWLLWFWSLKAREFEPNPNEATSRSSALG